MLTSDKVGAVLPALLSATTAIGHGVAKSKQGHGYRYADLSSLLELVCPHLEAQGLLLVSSQAAPDMVVTRVYHAQSGEWVEVSSCVSADGEHGRKGGPQGAQAAGSAYTYGRRYGIMALLAIAGEDDDGRAASTPRQDKTTPQAAEQAVAFSPAEVDHAVTSWGSAPEAWPASKQVGYRQALDSGKIKIGGEK